MQPSGYSRVMPARALKLMSFPALTCGAVAAVCLIAAPTEARTLNWFAKNPAQTYAQPEPMTASTPAPVTQGNPRTPPSPYGTVGDPFVRRLNWQSKHAIAPSYAQPIPQATPQPPAPSPIVYVPQPEPVRRPSVIMPPVIPAPALPLEAPQPAPQVVPQPTPRPVPAPVISAPRPIPPISGPEVSAPAEPRRDGAYQIPQTSKYYRGTRDATDTPVAPAAIATQDQGFTPGEVMTDPRTQSPRVYSLHRQYGLQPDAISSIDDNAPKPQSAPQTPATTAKP